MSARITARVSFALLAMLSSAARAQEPRLVSRADAVAATLARGPRLMLAAADTAAAFAQLRTARMWQNPGLSASYSKSTPQYHVTLELPLDLPYQRSPRVGAARASLLSSQLRYRFERAATALDADTTYTRALAWREHAQLSRRNAAAADSLHRIAVARRDAGDASDLDVELAAVNAGQAANVAAADSLAFVSAILDLQTVMGLGADAVVVTPADSLTVAASIPDTLLTAATLQVASASAALQSAQLSLTLQRRSLFGVPSIMGGFEEGDPSGSEPGILPTFGFSIPIPLFNLNRGPVTAARAEVSRARAELALVQAEAAAEIARGRRELATARGKIARDSILVGAANRVAAMSITAYREGASSLPTVLEAQRNARDVLAQYVDDTADALIAAAELRVLLLTPESAP